ncbi:hypothetical protein [Uliginosibacterium sp. 31-12]|uniref:hypothetical protein n=1 Tax=Uliginosibacterium sp. 31-12 TaxID=3062781 RepID=UPI0026E2F8A4|nr:hypothetical protein [Uliginosibacterium sp. 31-12]MDO6388472.1 hypothetical protein [Uliginosibacterium sp. 31-12]
MNKLDYMRIMQIPQEWEQYGMYPDELFALQVKRFEPEHVSGSEHDRNGMFHWWLKNEPSKDQLLKLVALSYLDPDKAMAEDVRSYIARTKNCDGEVRNALHSSASDV